VATYCGKCGSEVAADKPFCSVCGTQVATSAAAPPPFQPVAGSYQPVAPPPPPPAAPPPLQPTATAASAAGAPPYQPVTPSYQSASTPGQAMPAQPAVAVGNSSNTILKVVLIVIAIIIGIGVLGAGIFGYTVWRISRAIRADKNGTSISLPSTASGGGGTFSAGKAMTFTSSELGTDIYPGAQTGEGGMRMNLPGGSMVTAIYTTPDSKEQVLEFYKNKMGADASTMDSGNGAVISLKKGEDESVMVTVSSGTGENDGKTRIAIVHTKSTKPS